jgi:hypothetical protein
MANFFSNDVPSDSDNVSAGAGVIRQLKIDLDAMLDDLFDDDKNLLPLSIAADRIVASSNGKVLLSAQIQSEADDGNDATRAIGTNHLKSKCVTGAKIADAGVVPLNVSHSAFAFSYAGLGIGGYAANTYVVTNISAAALVEMTPPVTAHVVGQVFKIALLDTCPVSPKLRIGAGGGIATKDIVRADGSEIAAGELVAGQVIQVVYTNADKFQLFESVPTRIVDDYISVVDGSTPTIGTAARVFGLPFLTVPRIVDVRIVCTNADAGYSVGDEVPMHCFESDNGRTPAIVTIAAGSVTVRNLRTYIRGYTKATNSFVLFDSGSWAYKVYAWR